MGSVAVGGGRAAAGGGQPWAGMAGPLAGMAPLRRPSGGAGGPNSAVARSLGRSEAHLGTPGGPLVAPRWALGLDLLMGGAGVAADGPWASLGSLSAGLPGCLRPGCWQAVCSARGCSLAYWRRRASGAPAAESPAPHLRQRLNETCPFFILSYTAVALAGRGQQQGAGGRRAGGRRASVRRSAAT